MLKYLKEKIDRSYGVGGLKFAFLTLISNFLRKMETKIVYSINTLRHKNKKEILKKIYDFEMFLDIGCRGIQKQLIVNGDRETLAVETLRNKLKKGDVVLEAGANIGYYALLESKKIKNEGLIYAVEPSKKNYQRLIRNLNHNNIKNVKTYSFAFGNANKEAFLKISPHSNMNQVLSEEVKNMPNINKTKMKTIDTFLKNKRKPDVIRMDVEGYEYEIFQGMKNLLKENPPRILYIETHFGAMGKKKSKEFLNNLKRYGYEIKHCFLYETSTSKIPFLNYLDKKRLKPILNQKITIDTLLNREFDMNYLASLEIFLNTKKKINI